MTSQFYRHKTRNHKLRRCRFKAVTSAMFNYRCCLPFEQEEKKEFRSQKPEFDIRYTTYDIRTKDAVRG